MANLVADGTELQTVSGGYWFEISEGGLDSHPEVRGVDTIIPGRSGRVARDRVADSRTVILHGVCWGDGSTPRTSYRTRMDTLRGIFSPTAAPFDLVIYPTARGVGGGLATGTTATLNVRFLRFTGPPAIGDSVRMLDIECECIDSPPNWVIA